jgi:hypothetical protein
MTDKGDSRMHAMIEATLLPVRHAATGIRA